MNLKWFKSSVNEEIDECMVTHITIAVYDRSDIEEFEQLDKYCYVGPDLIELRKKGDRHKNPGEDRHKNPAGDRHKKKENNMMMKIDTRIQLKIDIKIQKKE